MRVNIMMLDHLGSPMPLHARNATMKEHLSFRTCGNRCSLTKLTALQPCSSSATDVAQGYTGYEHKDVFGVIHMSGRYLQ
jgi:hypothetical protein